ncbi:hypothetical protein ACFX15_045029 [Malus domestica]
MMLSAMKSLANVIGLELGSSCLYGSINCNSSLFRLVHLQRLDLSDNHFNLFQIPSRLGRDLTSLTYLNLSHSLFSSQVPSEISKLSKQSSLDLSFNDNFFAEYGVYISLTKAKLRSLVQNMTNLKQLHLGWVEIFSTFPDNFVNASSFTSLFLANCGFYGEFPVGVFHLPNLGSLCLQELRANFNRTNSFKKLNIGETSFSGPLPTSIGNLRSLTIFGTTIDRLYWPGKDIFTKTDQPLVSDYSRSWVGKLTKLDHLGLAYTNLTGKFPCFLANLTQLTELDLGSLPIPPQSIIIYDVANNDYNGEISPLFCSMNLQVLDLANSSLSGMFPQCLGNSNSLKVLNLPNNSFDGDIPQLCPNKNSLRMVDLSDNHLQGKLSRSLVHCTRLEFLNLGNNCIRDIFLSWLGELPVLKALILGHNEFHGIIGKPATNHEFPNLCFVDLCHNGFSDLSSNKFGEIPAGIIGKLRGLHLLNLSNNTLSGLIPSSLGNLRALESLDLSGNQLLRSNPSNLAQLNFFAYFNVSHNHLWGPIQ